MWPDTCDRAAAHAGAVASAMPLQQTLASPRLNARPTISTSLARPTRALPTELLLLLFPSGFLAGLLLGCRLLGGLLLSQLSLALSLEIRCVGSLVGLDVNKTSLGVTDSIELRP